MLAALEMGVQVDPSSVHDDEEEENDPTGQYICTHCKFATNETDVSRFFWLYLPGSLV